MADEALPGEGAVEIKLKGEDPILLKPSARAAITLCRQPGGLESDNPNISTVGSRLMGLDIDTMALVIRVGLNLGRNALPKLEEQIYETGLWELRSQLAPYIGALKNGGRVVKIVDEDEGGDGKAGANPRLASSNSTSSLSETQSAA